MQITFLERVDVLPPYLFNLVSETHDCEWVTMSLTNKEITKLKETTNQRHDKIVTAFYTIIVTLIKSVYDTKTSDATRL